eukprot:3751537-Prymnesium_polylepis.1
MVSEFLSELAGRLRCSRAEAMAYAAANPNSIIAARVAAGKAEDGVEARLILEPGAAAGKDKYFDNEQLIEQTKLAMEVFDAMERHVAPAREVKVASASLNLGIGANGNVSVQLSTKVCTKQLPAVRCLALDLFDHSSGHGAGATDSRTIANVNKGPDWNSKLPEMRDGFYFERRGGFYFEEQRDGAWLKRDNSFSVRIPQRMQFITGDVLPCDITVPTGIDANVVVGTTAVALPQVLPEQLLGRSIAKTLGGLQYAGKIEDINGETLLAVFENKEVGEHQLTVSEVLACLVGPPPTPAQHQEAPPTAGETVAALTLYFNGRRQTLKKKNPNAKGDELRALAEKEWPALAAERQLHFVRKAREAAGGTQAAPAVLTRGSSVPPRLVGRHKGSE